MSKCVESWHNLELSSGIPTQGWNAGNVSWVPGRNVQWRADCDAFGSQLLLPPDGYEPRRGNPTLGTATWSPDFGGSLLQATKDLVEVPNITNAVEVSKFYRGPEMRYWGFSFLQATPQFGAVISKGEQTRGGYNTGSLGSLCTGIPLNTRNRWFSDS
jgi:hypothetical protein